MKFKFCVATWRITNKSNKIEQINRLARREQILSSTLFSFWFVLCCVVLSPSAVSDSLRPHELKPARLLCPWDSPGKNTGVGSIPSSRGSSQPRDQTQASCIAGGFFTSWATREALNSLREENYMIVTLHARKACNKLPCLLKSKKLTSLMWETALQYNLYQTSYV